MRRPNIVFIFADEWRAQATGYAGDTNCETPVLDAFAAQSVNLSRAVSGCPVCCPYRASLMTGQYPLTHGVFINDVELSPDRQTIARSLGSAGYTTGYIGKWHIYGSPEGRCERRTKAVPRSHQLGFDHWWGYECCHNYWKSPYRYNDDDTIQRWDGYDAFAQAELAAAFITDHAKQEQPYAVMLSWGPPHFPLDSAPEAYRARYADRDIELRPNVPESHRDQAIAELRGYYAHIAALDDALKTVLDAIATSGSEDETIVVFTSDHGDMSQSHGLPHKLYAFDESIRVPCLIRYPAGLTNAGTSLPIPIDAPDIMPSLLGLAGVAIPDSVEGRDWSAHIRGDTPLTGDEAALLGITVSTTWMRHYGMKPYRGLRSERYTYTCDTDGPQFLFDNRQDPYQMRNVVHDPAYAEVRRQLETQLRDRLAQRGDAFESGEVYLERAGLSHYREANWPQKETWSYPWEDQVR